MVKIKKVTGFTTNTTIYKLENGKYIETLETRSNGETMRAWYVDEIGTPMDTPDFEVRMIYEPDSEIEECYNLIGFEKVV